MKNWKKNSWRKYPVKHIPEYPDKKELDTVLDKIGTFPPLVFAGETRHLNNYNPSENFYLHFQLIQKLKYFCPSMNL